MNDIKLFTETIIDRKRAAFTKQLAQHETNEQERYEQERLRLVEQQRLAKQQIDEHIQLNESKQKQHATNQKRNTLLALKQTYLTALFDKAEVAMTQWDVVQIKQFIESICQQLPADKTYTLTYGALFDHARTQIVLPAHISVASQTIPQEAGFVLSADGIDYNYLVSQLLLEQRKEAMGKIAKLL